MQLLEELQERSRPSRGAGAVERQALRFSPQKMDYRRQAPSRPGADVIIVITRSRNSSRICPAGFHGISRKCDQVSRAVGRPLLLGNHIWRHREGYEEIRLAQASRRAPRRDLRRFTNAVVLNVKLMPGTIVSVTEGVLDDGLEVAANKRASVAERKRGMSSAKLSSRV